MAIEIASIPILTGKVARNFEAEAQKTLKEYLRRQSVPELHAEDVRLYEERMQWLKKILNKSKIK